MLFLINKKSVNLYNLTLKISHLNQPVTCNLIWLSLFVSFRKLWTSKTLPTQWHRCTSVIFMPMLLRLCSMRSSLKLAQSCPSGFAGTWLPGGHWATLMWTFSNLLMVCLQFIWFCLFFLFNLILHLHC